MRNDHDLPMFLTLAEAGRHLGVKRSRAQQMAAQGILPTVRLGARKILVPRKALDALADGAIEKARALTRAE